jgi:hypothetical protein
MIFIVKSPPCSWLGEGRKALVVDKAKHKHTFDSPIPSEKKKNQQLTGVFSALHIGLARDACEFHIEGELSKGCTVFRDREKVQWLENSGGKLDAETEINCWGCLEHKEWAKEYVLNGDGTLSPKSVSKLVLGLSKGGDGKLVFVKRDDTRRRLVLGGGEELESYFKELRAEAAAKEAARTAIEAEARAQLTTAWCTEFRENGYGKLESLVPRDLVEAARGEINRQLGVGDKTSDAFKAKTFANHPAIISLVKDSAVPWILSELIGDKPDWFRARLTTGQLALRFPGDMCPPGVKPGPEGEISAAHFDGIRKGWHIDGCPNDFIRGQTDHYGTIHNFDVLIGVLLSDVKKPMSGELVVYPGSHHALAAHFRTQKGALDKLRDKGMDHLPTKETDALFKQPVVHCTGKAGDVFFANYMTAHLIAPNVSPDIRYAVYFRVSGPRFDKTRLAGGGNVGAMLEPWSMWEGLHRRCDGANAAKPSAAVPQAPLTRSKSTLAEQTREVDMQRHLASADYEYLQRQHTKKVLAQAGQGAASPEVLESLECMFPHAERGVLVDVLAECKGNADAAVDRLIQLFPPKTTSIARSFRRLFGSDKVGAA